VPYGILDINQIFAAGHGRDIFQDRDISRDGAIVVVRPDQYVAGVLPLNAREELTAFFAGHMTAPHQPGSVVQNGEQVMEVGERIQLLGSEL
jgi:phenol 2-monooxygenase